MTDSLILEGDFTLNSNEHFAVVSGRFNSLFVEHLTIGCADTLMRYGVAPDRITLAKVPGARELPLAVKALAATNRYAAIIALGVIIRGATPHFDYVASSCSQGLAQISLEFSLPVIFGVLTVDTIEQAIERAGTKAGNKGAEAAVNAIEMVSLLRKIRV